MVVSKEDILISEMGGRIERLPLSKYLYLLSFIIATGSFFDVYLLTIVGPTASSFFASTHSTGLSSLYVTLFFLATFIGAISLGFLSDYIGRKNAFTIDIAFILAGSIFAAFSTTGYELLAAVFIAGLGTGAEIPISVLYIEELVPGNIRAKVVTFVNIFVFSAAVLSGAMSYFFIPYVYDGIPGYKFTFIVLIVGAILVLFLRFRLPESPRWLERKGKLELANIAIGQIEKGVMKSNNLSSLPSYKPEEAINTKKISDLRLYFTRNYLRRTTSGWGMEFFNGFVVYGFSSFVVTLLYLKGFSLVHSFLYTMIIFIGWPVSVLYSNIISERWQRRYLIGLNYGLAAIAGISFLLSSNVYEVVISGFMLTFFTLGPALFMHIYVTEVYPTTMRSKAGSTAYSMSRLGGFVAPIIAVYFLATAAKMAGDYIIGLAIAGSIIVILLGFFVAVNTTRIPLEEIEEEGLFKAGVK